MRILDLCAGAGGKALALAAAAPGAQILATDTNRARLSKLAPRAERAGAPDRDPAARPAARARRSWPIWTGQADVVLVDAPCSGSGTWRRNPEGRWRLTPERLERLVRLQARLLDIAAPAGQARRRAWSMPSARSSAPKAQARRRNFLGRRSSWIVQETPYRRRACGRAGTAPDPGARRHRRLFRRAARPAMLGRRDWLEMIDAPVHRLFCASALPPRPLPVAGRRPEARRPDRAQVGRAAAAGRDAARRRASSIEADDALEAALAVDPRNRAAFVVMARVAQKQKLYGQAIRLTNKALALEPTDRDALAVQGEAMVELGAVPRARENLAKLQKLCATPAARRWRCCRRRSAAARRWPRPSRRKSRRRTSSALAPARRIPRR